MAGNPPAGMNALVAGSAVGLIENEMIRGLPVRAGVIMMPLVVTLVVGLGWSEYKSCQEQSNRSSHDSQASHVWSSGELLMHSGAPPPVGVAATNDRAAPLPVEKLQKLYRGSNPPASAERKAGPRHFQVQVTVSESPSPEKTCAPNDPDELKFPESFDVSTPSSLAVGAEILCFVKPLLFRLLRSPSVR
jgi:hypothetical protein